MTLAEAMTEHGPDWLEYWMYFLGAGGLLAPVLLLIWRPSRLAGVLGIVAFGLSIVGVEWLYQRYGYSKILGLPHILLWTPLAVYLFTLIRGGTLPALARMIAVFMLVIIVISLAFDYADVTRYVLGERTPLAMPAPVTE